MAISRFIAVGCAMLLVLVPAIALGASSENGGNEREPAPEPYSFSYQSESAGGLSSHQESGDGTGRVQGFYTIMGEDGRDRRVDYVADENGYRASVSTNEVGTRTENTADAQYQARLPSQGQLQQAKVSAEEYQYLEEQHAAERERHLTNRQQQQQQQQFAFNQSGQQWNQFQSANPGGSRPWSTNNQQFAGAWNQQQPQWQQQQPQASYLQGNYTTGFGGQLDEGWQRGAKQFRNDQQSNQQQLLPQQQQYAQNQWAASAGLSSVNQQQQRGFAWNNQTNEQSLQQLPQAAFGSLASATTIGPLAAALANAPAPAPQRQQAQLAAWQLADRGAAPARLPLNSNLNNNNNNNNYLQRQLQQQFMQQAYQLTDQDYPRQSVQFSRQNDFNSNYNNNNNQFLAQQQQWPQRFLTNGEQNFRANFSGLGGNFVQQQQQPWRNSLNNYNNISTGGEFSQINQQQNNVIDEVSGEQVDTQQLGNTSEDTTGKNVSGGGNYTTSTLVQFGQQGLRPQQQLVSQQPQQQQQFVQPITTSTTTTTSQPAPTGFFAINLGQDNSTSTTTSTSSGQQEQVDQEVDSKQPQPQPQQQLQQNFNNGGAQTTFGGQKTTEQSVQTQNNAGDYQQVTFQQQQQPNSIKQQVDGNQQQQVTGGYQANQQVAFGDSSTQDTRPDTTTDGPELITTQQQQQKGQQQVVETSQTPQGEISTTTTSSSIASQRPSSFLQQQQFVPATSTVPTRVPYDISTVDSQGGSFVQQLGRRPTSQLQQVLGGGVKGQFVGAAPQRELGVNSTYYNRFQEPAVGQRVVFAGRPTSTEGSQAFNTTSGGAYQQSTFASERPVELGGNRFQITTNEQSSQQQVPYQRPTSVFEFNRQREQQQQGLTGGEVNTTTSVVAPTRVSVPSNVQQWEGGVKGGVKGGSKVGRRQFWTQQQPLIPNSQRVFPSQQQQPAVAVSPNQASVDYAASVSSYGSRISGRR